MRGKHTHCILANLCYASFMTMRLAVLLSLYAVAITLFWVAIGGLWGGESQSDGAVSTLKHEEGADCEVTHRRWLC